ncbi:MAG TPA: PhzF family phenazine biosynthesis protein [Blastocatellia bacterium]|nr:PhzF family phenazine biosynthesis protein [Blastocatellia bacterium]
MNKAAYVIADVFAERQFGGNQLAVFTDGLGLDSETMQNLAREMNFSETTFLLPPEKGGDFRVRIFTPAFELPFAGHPIVGTAFVIFAEGLRIPREGRGTVTLETGVGLLSVEVAITGERSGHSVMTQPIPEVVGEFKDKERLARALSLDASDIESTGLPVEAINNGITVIIVPVGSLEAVRKIKIDSNALETITREAGAVTLLAFTTVTLRPESSAHCRVYAPGAGVGEDPATGSANGPLGFYLVRHGLINKGEVNNLISEQGFEMNRPSIIQIEITNDRETGDVKGVRVGGGVVLSGRGEILLS